MVSVERQRGRPRRPHLISELTGHAEPHLVAVPDSAPRQRDEGIDVATAAGGQQEDPNRADPPGSPGSGTTHPRT
jgi:hypothetical protein